MSADLYLGTLPIRIYRGIELLMYSGPNSVMCLIIETPVYFDVAEWSPSRWPSEHQPMIINGVPAGRLSCMYVVCVLQ